MTEQLAVPLAGAPVSETRPLLVAGRWTAGDGPALAVIDKYLRTPCGHVSTASHAQVEAAIAGAHAAFRAGPPAPFERGAVLDRAATLVEARLPELAILFAATTETPASRRAG